MQKTNLMEFKNLSDISNADLSQLLYVIDYYKDYSSLKVLLVYAELKKRGYNFENFPKRKEKLSNFSSENRKAIVL